MKLSTRDLILFALFVLGFFILGVDGAPNLGDFDDDEAVHFIWSTFDGDGASVTRATDGTVAVYKDNGTTQSIAGVTDTEDFDSVTGLHACTIDLSADAFYATGANYTVVLSAATIDGQIVNAVLAHFSVENRYERGTDSANTTTPLDAAGVRGAVGMANADLDTQLGTLSTHTAANVATLILATPAQKLVTDANGYVTYSNTAPLDAAGVRGAVGMANADLDTQLGTLSTHTAANVWAVATRSLTILDEDSTTLDLDGTTVGTVTTLSNWHASVTDWTDGGRLDLILDAILGDTGELQTNQGNWLTATGFATAVNLATLDTVADAMKLVTDKLDTAMELDGAEYRFTENALEQAPSGTGGDASAANQATIIELIQAGR